MSPITLKPCCWGASIKLWFTCCWSSAREEELAWNTACSSEAAAASCLLLLLKRQPYVALLKELLLLEVTLEQLVLSCSWELGLLNSHDWIRFKLRHLSACLVLATILLVGGIMLIRVRLKQLCSVGAAARTSSEKEEILSGAMVHHGVRYC